LKPHGISEQEWAIQIIAGQTERGKKSLLNSMNMTVEGVAQASNNYDWAWHVR
jgi:hypothetical protein